MRILVTGCNGQVGHSLIKQLSKYKDIIVLGCDKKNLDITNQKEVSRIVNDFKPSIIINAAAYTAVDKAENDIEMAYMVNRNGPKYLAEAAQKMNAAIIHISTDYVFDGYKSGEYDEEDLTNPQGIYGKSKLAGEIEVSNACSKYIILRTAWVFSEYGNNFVKTMLKLGSERDELNIVCDQFGGPTYAGDIASALIDISICIFKDKPINYGIYHFSGLPHVSWYEFAKIIFYEAHTNTILNQLPKLTGISTEQYPTPTKRPSNSKLNTEKISKEFSIKASDWKNKLSNIILQDS
ncbi:dTDP-4-dehydrorhamnose reductase [Providencia rettgeri]